MCLRSVARLSSSNSSTSAHFKRQKLDATVTGLRTQPANLELAPGFLLFAFRFSLLALGRAEPSNWNAAW